MICCYFRLPAIFLCKFRIIGLFFIDLNQSLDSVLEEKVEQLVLVNCCDSMRRVYDIVESTGKCKFLYMLDLPHEDNECEKVKFAASIRRLKTAYEKCTAEE